MSLTMSFQEAADRVKQSLDIVEIVQRHVVLRKAGRSYVGKCPFHNDKNPSMNVNREKNLFKCFACGVGGDALAFLMKKENLSYGEVIRELAEQQGITIISEGRSQEQIAQEKDTRQKLLELNTAAAEWFVRQLQSNNAESAAVREYLVGRQTSAAIMTQFQLGFAPPGWENLATHLRRQFEFVRQELKILMDAGLVNQRDNQQGYYDRFRNRLIIPIHDERGQVVAFGGRALSDDDKPKYLNSPETPLYKKHQTLFGAHIARDAIRQTRSAVVMEGYFDVMAAHEAGLAQTVGSCGTALTDNHLKLLSRLGAETIYLAFDSDEAGLKAALSAIQLIEPYLESAALQLKVLVVPDGKDPDGYIRSFAAPEQARAAMAQLLEKAVHYLEFKLNMAIRGADLSTPQGRLEAAHRLTPVFSGIRQPLVRSEYVRIFADRLRISEEALLLEIKRYERAQKSIYRQPFEPRKNPRQKQAISKYGPTSLKRHRPVLVDNLTELRVALTSRQDTPEKNLLRLMLINNESYRTMHAFLSTQPVPALEDLRVQALWTDIQTLNQKIEPMADNPLGTLIDQMNHGYTENPELQALFTDLAFTAESLAESLNLGGLTGPSFQEKIVTLATKYVEQIASAQQLQSLRQLTRKETDEVELQYLLREQLSSQRLGSHKHPPPDLRADSV